MTDLNCLQCSAHWYGDELITAGKISNSCCQNCGYDSRIHGPAEIADKVWAPSEWWTNQT